MISVKTSKHQNETIERLKREHDKHDCWVDFGTVCDDGRVFVMFTNLFDTTFRYTVYRDGQIWYGK
jgi:hypothetical protein